MKAVDIVNRLKEILPKYTNAFNDEINISLLTKSGNTITATSTTNHGLETGEYITVKGAKEQITLNSITFIGKVATATSSTSNKLYRPSQSPYYVNIESANPDYNGSFKIIELIDDFTFTFQLINIPTATSSGKLIIDDFDGYNGYKQITKISDTQFSYQNTSVIQSPAIGTIKALTKTRIDSSATIDRIKEDYLTSKDLNTWLYVILGNDETFKNDTTAQDITGMKRENQIYRYELLQRFSILIVVNSINSIRGGEIADQIKSYLPYLLKSICNYQLPSLLTDQKYQPAIYLGSQNEDYDKSYLMHRFDFACEGVIIDADTKESSIGVSLRVIDGNIPLSTTINMR